MFTALRRLNCLLFAGLLAAGLTSCGGETVPVAENPKPVVLCTIFAYFDAARAIGADAVDVKILLPPGQSPHDYSTTISDKVTAAKAKLYIKNGMGLDDRFDKILEGGNAKVLDIGQAIPKDYILTTTEIPLDPKEVPATRPSANPHIWLDPYIQKQAAEKIRDALIEIDPGDKSMFEINARTYMAEIMENSVEFQKVVDSFKRKEFIGFHSAYDYLAHRYGLKQIASIEEIPGEGLNPAQLEKIINLILEKHIHFIAMETALSDKGDKLIKERTGVTTFILQPLETYDNVKDTYVSLMKSNLDELTKALGGP